MDDIRISDISTVVVNAEMRNWVFVKVRTSVDGLHGWGEASLNWKTRAVTGAVEDLKQLLIGRDALAIEQALAVMRKHSYYRLGIVGETAISGVEHALWDIKGKALGVPVWQLLGGRCRSQVRVYTHLGIGDMVSVYETSTTSQLVERALAVIEAGYDAIKVVLIPFGNHLPSPTAVRHVGQMMEALREAVGWSVDLMIDFHGRPASVGAALAYLDAVAESRPYFCEEPVQPGDTGAMERVRARAQMPIAAGERLVGLREFVPLITAGAVDVVQPDLNHTGGLLEGKRVAALAEACGVGVAPHNPNGPVAGAAALHFAVSTPNFVIQEEMTGAVPWYDDVCQWQATRGVGYWEPTSAPGLGIEINEVEAAKHPFKAETVHSLNATLADGTVVDW